MTTSAESWSAEAHSQGRGQTSTNRCSLQRQGQCPDFCLAVFILDNQPETDPGGVQPVPGDSEVRGSLDPSPLLPQAAVFLSQALGAHPKNTPFSLLPGARSESWECTLLLGLTGPIGRTGSLWHPSPVWAPTRTLWLFPALPSGGKVDSGEDEHIPQQLLLSGALKLVAPFQGVSPKRPLILVLVPAPWDQCSLQAKCFLFISPVNKSRKWSLPYAGSTPS